MWLDAYKCRCYVDSLHIAHWPKQAIHNQGNPREFELVKLTLRDKETAQEAVRRFRKLVERSGIKKEIRIREFYEKPSETKRRARLRAARRSRRERMLGRS